MLPHLLGDKYSGKYISYLNLIMIMIIIIIINSLLGIRVIVRTFIINYHRCINLLGDHKFPDLDEQIVENMCKLRF